MTWDDDFYHLYGNEEYEEAMDGPENYEFFHTPTRLKPKAFSPKVCSMCGEKDLYWKQLDNGKWRLFKAGKQHVCNIESEQKNLPCPYCGSEKLRVKKYEHIDVGMGMDYYSISCDECNSSGPMTGSWKTEKDAWNLWNSRKVISNESN